MKILRHTTDDIKDTKFSIMGLTTEEFYTIKHALAARASKAADNDKNKDMMDYEKDNAILTWNEFSTAAHTTIQV